MPEETKIYTIKLDDLVDKSEAEIGIYAANLHKINELKIDIPNGFVITASAFEDFLVANDMVSEIHAWLKTLNGDNMTDIQKAADNIRELFRAAVIPASIFEKIKEGYESISRFEETMINVQLSWIPELKSLTGGIDSNYYLKGICGISELEKIVKTAWQAPFDAKAIFERMQKKYQGNISIALVVKKTIASELSGKLYSYNPLTNNQNEQEIQAVLGLWEGVDELEIVPDHYIVNKQNEAIEEKNVMTQSSMMLKKGFVKAENEDRFMKVGISKAWQIRQKASDKIIQDLSVIGKTFEERFNENVEFDWVVEAGKIFITSLKFNPRFRHSNSISFNPNIIRRDEYEMKEKPLKVEIINDESIKKTLDDYVDEIESEISNIDSVDWDEETNANPQIAHSVGQIAPRVGPNNIRPDTMDRKKMKIENIVNPKIEPVEKPIELELYEKINYQFLFKEKFQTVTKVYIDIDQKKPIRNLNSDGFDGVIGIKGEDLITGYGVNLSKAKAENLEGFVNYGVTQLMKLIEKDRQKDYIYSLSDLTLNEALKFAGVSVSALNVHINTNVLLDLELEILRVIRNKKNFRRLWFSMKGFNQIGDYKFFKSILDNHTLKKSPSFRFFMEIDLIPPFLNISEYLDETIDGLIIDLDLILKQLIGNKVSVTSIMKNSLFWNMLDNISIATEKKKIPLILRTKLILESDELLQQLLKYGIFGVTINPEKLLEIRNDLHKMELKNLD
ncbi:hypothetical protein KBD45_04535 [Candidatus Dojkabacteria bacterium]|nr:hypothetical protein [Candidatus Dojkabacteria bacterium]